MVEGWVPERNLEPFVRTLLGFVGFVGFVDDDGTAGR